ncbi:CARDB domain-containing protein [Thermococcus peptonophilus]|uniref:CARDB domain-containing protein n=1 Tax=Thermococcus peptonophilus TaxID=53952 RepID=UPI000A731520
MGLQGIAEVGGEFSYIGNTSIGLQTLEIKIPWSALGGRPDEIAIIAWVAGGDGSSAVDSLPVDPAIDYSNIGGEWGGDTDTFTNLAVLYVESKTIDGNLNDWSSNEIAAVDKMGVGVPGGNLSKLYVSWDKDYLYLAIVTNNTANWGGMAYGFGIDVDPGTGNGYTGGGDAWGGRQINFTNGYAIDYEVYFWWDDGQAKITAAQLNPYNGNWDWPNLVDVGGKYNYTGDSSTGLKTLEVAIPWSAIGGMHSHFAVSAWITGGSGSAVDILPQESVAVDSADEWNDIDAISQMAEFEMFLMPDLKVSLSGPGVAGLNRTTTYNVTVENGGSLPANNVNVRVYVNDTLYTNWTTDLGAGEKKWFTLTWKPNETGVYTIKTTVDEENKIPEANEDNNVATMNVEVIWVGKIDVDGDPSDWPTAEISENNYTVVNGTFIWADKIGGDNRKDKDEYLPGKTSSHADLTEIAVTKDDRYVYFMFRFANMSNIKIGDNGATFVAVPIDYKDGGSRLGSGKNGHQDELPLGRPDGGQPQVQPGRWEDQRHRRSWKLAYLNALLRRPPRWNILTVNGGRCWR